MDYQASKGCSRKVSTVMSLVKNSMQILFFAFVGIFLTFGVLEAQLAPNPLSTDIELIASVLVNGNTNPDTRPVPPGPLNMVDTTNLAIFQGISYPGSSISVLKNGTQVAQVGAFSDGTFDLRVRDLAPGVYTFGLRAEDTTRLLSKLLPFTVTITPGVATTINGIVFPPTLTSDKVAVKKGDPVIIFGSAAPLSELYISFTNASEIIKKTQVSASGTWRYAINSSELPFGENIVKARSVTKNVFSPYSETITFTVGDMTVLRKKLSLSGFRARCDLNDDGRVNLLDFSIMAYWYKRLGFPMKVDLNTDHAVNLTDLSILAYCWTG